MMKPQLAVVLEPETIDFYRDVMVRLNEAKVPFLVGGAFAFGRYTGIERHTKDFDIFLRKQDIDPALKVLEGGGYRPEWTFPHWLAKSWNGEDFVDLIFSAGNAVAVVDEVWFDKSVDGEVFGMKAKLCPAEEMIWSKSFIMERERFDGADVAHLIYARGRELDWRRLVKRFDQHWRVLFSHVVMFGFIYPGYRDAVPRWVIDEFSDRLKHESDAPTPDVVNVCGGTLVSRQQYLLDLQNGFEDARLQPRGNMSEEDIDHWTRAIWTIQ
jgi:hypothetical protein